MKFAEINVRIIEDSITDGGSRLVTWEWTYPRFIHAEIMTHRALSRNLASSRAIPTAKLRQRVMEAPVVPKHWGANRPGMQATDEVGPATAAIAQQSWLAARDYCAAMHSTFEVMGIHKQVTNRLIEPWMSAVGLVTMTDHANLFHLRRHKDAEPHFQELANKAWELFHEHMPTYRAPGEWHMPFISGQDRIDAHRAARQGSSPCDTAALVGDALRREQIDILRKVSTGRCARISYMTHDGRRDLAEDVALHDRLAGSAADGSPMHASPFEHVAQAVGGRKRIKNFEGWMQYRCLFEHESGPNTDDRCERCGCWDGRHVAGCVW